MPELPEVETIRRQLGGALPFTVEEEWHSPFIGGILYTPWTSLKGDTVERLQRHGKILVFCLRSGRLLVSQLGMSGNWRISRTPLEEKHRHLCLKGEGGFFTYLDPRRFGRLRLWAEGEWEDYKKGLGIDPSTDEFTLGAFASALKTFPRRMVKVTLLDQALFSGVGNYMASEICALAGVRPTRRAGRLTQKEIGRLFDATKSLVRNMLAAGGLTFGGGYRDAFGEEGGGRHDLVVFSRKSCGQCGQIPVKKIVLQGRGTYYCPRCQR